MYFTVDSHEVFRVFALNWFRTVQRSRICISNFTPSQKYFRFMHNWIVRFPIVLLAQQQRRKSNWNKSFILNSKLTLNWLGCAESRRKKSFCFIFIWKNLFRVDRGVATRDHFTFRRKSRFRHVPRCLVDFAPFFNRVSLLRWQLHTLWQQKILNIKVFFFSLHKSPLDSWISFNFAWAQHFFRSFVPESQSPTCVIKYLPLIRLSSVVHFNYCATLNPTVVRTKLWSIRPARQTCGKKKVIFCLKTQLCLISSLIQTAAAACMCSVVHLQTFETKTNIRSADRLSRCRELKDSQRDSQALIASACESHIATSPNKETAVNTVSRQPLTNTTAC